MWFQNFDTYIQGIGFVRSKDDHCGYYKQVGEYFIYVVLHVNDMLLVGNNMKVIKEVKSQLSSKFGVKDLGAANSIFWMHIKRDHVDRKIQLNQRKYVETTLHRCNMKECKTIKFSTPIGAKLFVD